MKDRVRLNINLRIITMIFLGLFAINSYAGDAVKVVIRKDNFEHATISCHEEQAWNQVTPDVYIDVNDKTDDNGRTEIIKLDDGSDYYATYIDPKKISYLDVQVNYGFFSGIVCRYKNNTTGKTLVSDPVPYFKGSKLYFDIHESGDSVLLHANLFPGGSSGGTSGSHSGPM